jgi:hypothetical protein
MKNAMAMAALTMSLCGCTTVGWRGTLESELPVFGHRNWIVVADMAYPKQSAAGIATIYTDAGQIETLATVLAAIEDAPHVNPIVLVDQEMDHVTEADAPGIEAYRKQLKRLLKDRQVEVMPHEDIIKTLDADAKTFNILLLKTDMTIPYTSVFLKLDCGYWNADKEARLRKALSGKD